MLQSLIASLGFDPWLWCRSAQCCSGKYSVEVALSPWSRLAPVSLAQSKLRSLQAVSVVRLLGVTYSSRIPWCAQPGQLFPYRLPSLLLCPRAGRLEENCWEECQKAACSLPCLKIGILLWVFVFCMVFVLNKSSMFVSSTAPWAGSRVSLPSRDLW